MLSERQGATVVPSTSGKFKCRALARYQFPSSLGDHLAYQLAYHLGYHTAGLAVPYYLGAHCLSLSSLNYSTPPRYFHIHTYQPLP